MKRIILLILSVLLLLSTVPAMGESISAADAVQSSETLFANYTPEELLQQWYQISALLRANGLYPFVELEKGDVGYEVMALQTRLAELGYYQKTIVDNFGNGTYNAMRDFEKANGLKVNGKASVADQQLLYSSEAVSYSKQSKTSSNNNSSESDAVSGATSYTP